MFPLKEVYQENFSNWEDVVKEFSGTRWNDEAAALMLAANPEPEEVFLARYDVPGYEGSAVVFWRNGNHYYSLQGSHCSCYGLEETGFDPEVFESKELFVNYLKKVQWIYGLNEGELEALIEYLENR